MRTGTRSTRRMGLAATLAVAGALAVPSAALAAPAVVSFPGGAFTVRAAPATEDAIQITTLNSGGVLYFVARAPDSRVASVAPCITGGGGVLVACPGAGAAQSILVEAGDQDDSVSVAAPVPPVPSTIRLGRGDDRATGGPGPERISGGRGSDSVRGGGGNDTLDMKGGGRDVRIDCGPGNQDVAIIDDSDARPKNCERIRR